MRNESPVIAIKATNLLRRFGDFVAVNDVSFEVAKGEVFGLLGPNGAGKSTIVKLLCGLLMPSGGTAQVGGFDVSTQPDLAKMQIGYMSQRFSLYDDLTVEENLGFFSGIYDIPTVKRRNRIDWAIKIAGLSEHRRTLAVDLAAGFKRRLALGCALMHEPMIVFLDEPTSGIDPISRRQFWDLIYELAEAGTTVFVTTHYMDEAEYCHRLGLVYRGELIACGSPGSLKRDVIRDTVIEVVCDLPASALTVVQDTPGVNEAGVFGNTIHALTVEPAAVIPLLKAQLVEHGFPPLKLGPTRPSLEDVFVSLIWHRDRDRPTDNASQ